MDLPTLPDSPPTATEIALARALRPVLALLAEQSAVTADDPTVYQRGPCAERESLGLTPRWMGAHCPTIEGAVRTPTRGWSARRSAIVAYLAARRAQRRTPAPREAAAPANDSARALLAAGGAARRGAR